MGVYAGPANAWSNFTDENRIDASTKVVVQDGLVLNLDAGASTSYPGSGTSWTDLSGNGNNGTLVNGVGYDSDNGGSLTFDGVNDYISGSISTLANWSISLWHLSKDITSQVVFYPFSCNTGSSKSGLGFGGTYALETINRWYFYDGTTIFSNSNTSITTNVWYNLVVTKNSTTYNLYTNGSFSYSFSGVEISYTNYNIGRRTDDVWYSKGDNAQASIYNRALTASEISQNFNALRGRFGI